MRPEESSSTRCIHTSTTRESEVTVTVVETETFVLLVLADLQLQLLLYTAHASSNVPKLEESIVFFQQHPFPTPSPGQSCWWLLRDFWAAIVTCITSGVSALTVPGEVSSAECSSLFSNRLSAFSMTTRIM